MAQKAAWKVSVGMFLDGMQSIKDTLEGTMDPKEYKKSFLSLHMPLLALVCACAGVAVAGIDTETGILEQWLDVVASTLTSEEWCAICTFLVDVKFRDSPWSGVAFSCKLRKHFCRENPASSARFPIPHDIMRREQKIQREKAVFRMSHQIVVDLSCLTTVCGTIKHCLTCLPVDDLILYKWIKILMVCGCRTSEVVMSTFEHTRPLDTLNGVKLDSRVEWIRMSKLLKKRDRKDVAVLRPLLYGVSASSLLSSVAEVRSYCHSLGIKTVLDVNKHFQNALCAIVHTLFHEQYEFALSYKMRMGAHFLRALYANVSWFMLSDAFVEWNKAVFVTRVLGHEPTDINSGLHYQVIKMSAPEGAELPVLAESENEEVVEEGEAMPPPTTVRKRRTTSARLKTNKKEYVEIKKFKRKFHMTPEMIRARCTEALGCLLENDVPLTGANIKRLGIGSAAFNIYGREVLKDHKNKTAAAVPSADDTELDDEPPPGPPVLSRSDGSIFPI